MRTLILLLTATLLVLAGTLAVVEPGFNIVPVSPLKCEAPNSSDPAVCLDEQRN